MPVEPFSLLAIFSATIILGYIGYIIFEKTGISDIIWLLIFGIMVGPVLNLVEKNIFLAALPLLSALALLIILFDAGINMDFYQVVHGFARSMLLAVLNVLASMFVVGVVSIYLFNITFLEGILLGAIVGGTSSAIVIALTARLRVREGVKTLLNLESIFTDPLTVVIPIALIGILIQTNTTSPLNTIFSSFSTGAVIGLFSGIPWLFALDRLKGRPFDYMLTLAALLLIYVFVESVGGSGAIASLTFGIVLGNGKAFSTMLKFSKKFTVDQIFKTFHAEISFFIRAFFFVYLGIIVSIKPTFIVYGIAISAVLIIMRFFVVRLSTSKMNLTKPELKIMNAMAPRGLAAAVLSQLPATFGMPNANIFSDVVFIVILSTVIYTTIAVKLLFRNVEETH